MVSNVEPDAALRRGQKQTTALSPLATIFSHSVANSFSEPKEAAQSGRLMPCAALVFCRLDWDLHEAYIYSLLSVRSFPAVFRRKVVSIQTCVPKGNRLGWKIHGHSDREIEGPRKMSIPISPFGQSAQDGLLARSWYPFLQLTGWQPVLRSHFKSLCTHANARSS